MKDLLKKPELSHKQPMQGVETWINPKNGFTVFELHYSADPDKRTKEWKHGVKSGMPRRKFLQEYELVWESWTGKPVYADWNRPLHGVLGVIKPHIGLPLLRGWDFGITPACVIAQLQGNTLCVIKEFTAYNEGIETFSEKVLKNCRVLWPIWADLKTDWLDFYDPSGNRKSDINTTPNNAVSCANVLRRKGLNIIPGLITFEDRKRAVESFLCKQYAGVQAFQISIPDCPILIRGFNGGYRYPDHISVAEVDINRMKALKDEHSHPHDALQYIAGGVNRPYKRRILKIPIPQYGFLRSHG